MTQIRKIYIDMDGVIADFDKLSNALSIQYFGAPLHKTKKPKGALWAAVGMYQKEGNEFWYDLEPYPDTFKLFEFVSKYDHEILSACGNKGFNADPQKRRWMTDVIKSDIVVNLVEKSSDKAQFAAPDAVLIDDRAKSIDPWVAAGGIGILHTSINETIATLREMELISLEELELEL